MTDRILASRLAAFLLQSSLEVAENVVLGVARCDEVLPGCSIIRADPSTLWQSCSRSMTGLPKGFDTADLIAAKRLWTMPDTTERRPIAGPEPLQLFPG